jgi:hypothetical protein
MYKMFPPRVEIGDFKEAYRGNRAPSRHEVKENTIL